MRSGSLDEASLLTERWVWESPREVVLHQYHTSLKSKFILSKIAVLSLPFLFTLSLILVIFFHLPYNLRMAQQGGFFEYTSFLSAWKASYVLMWPTSQKVWRSQR